MPLKNVVIALVFFQIPLLLCSGQSFTTINYSVSDGLPSNEAYEVFQDRNGFLWFGTDNGVVKYDGYEMVRLGVEDGLTDPVVFGFHEDQRGRIWFRTFSGKLSYYQNGRVYPYKYNHKLTEHTTQSIVSSLYVDSLDRVWFSTFRHDGVYASIDSSGNVNIHAPKASIYHIEIGKGRLVGYKQVPLIDLQVNDRIFSIGEVGYCDVFNVLSTYWNGKLYISACRNLYEYDGVSAKKVFEAPYPIISLSTDTNNNLWVGYMSKGVDKFSSPDFIRQATPDILKQLSVSKVFQDNKGGLWFSTLEKGLFYVPDLLIKNYEMPDALKIRFVASGENCIFISTNNGDLFQTSENNELKSIRQFSPPIKGLYVDQVQNVWVTSARHSQCFNFASGEQRSYESSLTNATEDKNGNLYTVSGGAMIVIIKNDRKTVVEKVLPFMCRNVFVQDTTVFIVTRSGLYASDLEINQAREIRPLSDFKINRILKLNDSTLLLTTIGRGFLVFNAKTYTYKNYYTNHQFVANNIYAALQHRDIIWLGTENGLVKLKQKSLFGGNPEFEILTRQNGLISTQITQLAFKDNVIWAFSDNGYSLLDDRPVRTGGIPKVYLKNIKINNREISPEKRIVPLSFEQNNIEINFGFISLNRQKIFIRHRLQESEPWNYTEAKTLHFYSLAPGTYAIETEYSLNNINWHKGFISPRFAISPPFWKTWYFFSAAAFTAGLLIFLFFRHQMIVYRRHQLKLIQSEIQTIERERTRIAKDLHDSVGTDFSAIKMMVSQLLKKHQEPEAEEIESQFQNSIQEIKAIIYGLAPPGLERYGLMTGLRNYTQKINGKVLLLTHLEKK
jgi:signal transduction histidine kinase